MTSSKYKKKIYKIIVIIIIDDMGNIPIYAKWFFVFYIESLFSELWQKQQIWKINK